ncbi:MAG TPA: radical SAM protein [Synechococcales cyanobacterium M55_K2018_004]|nr:radical SAM protein [Synechococcales cyanobacterium M55_K2018_004]
MQSLATPVSPEGVSSVYGPVTSWRYGRSLGIDPIGAISTCSFDCVYCQLGEIERKQRDRALFVPTSKILQDLQPFAPWQVDVITLSGSGEPTLALNLGEILTQVKALTSRPVGVLTNGTLLAEATVRRELAIADQVAVKLDAVSAAMLRRVNRPVEGITLDELWQSFCQFRREFAGRLSVQTMVLTPWSSAEQEQYLAMVRAIAPDEIHLNTPTRPRPLRHQLEARGNHPPEQPEYAVRYLKPVSAAVLKEWGDRLQAATGIPVYSPPLPPSV